MTSIRKNKKAYRTEGVKTSKPIIYNITQTSIVRQRQDIEKWRNAMRSAESKTNPRRTQLYDLYFDLVLDAHLSAVMEKRVLAVTNQPIIYYDKDGEENEEITKLLDTIEMNEAIGELLNSKFWGHTLLEFEFNPDKLCPYLVPRKHVEPHQGIILKSQYDVEGFPYRVGKYANYTLEAGNPDDLGLLLKAAPYILWKRGGFGDFSQYAELFGMPYRVYKYDAYDNETRLKLEEAAKEAGSAAYVIIPEGVSVEHIQNNTSGSKELYGELIKQCDQQISKLFLGQTMTTDDGSSKSQADVHMQVEEQIHFADKLFIERILTAKLKPLLAKHGYNVGDGYYSFLKTETLTEQEKLDIAIQVNSVAPVDKQYFYETFNLPESTEEPEEPEETEDEQEDENENIKMSTLKRFFSVFS